MEGSEAVKLMKPVPRRLLSGIPVRLPDCIHQNPDIRAHLTSHSRGIVKVMKAQQSSPQRSALLLCY